MCRNYCIFLIFLMNFRLFTADVSLSLLFSADGGLKNDSVKCTELLNAFAHSASNLTMCSIIYARPVRLCEKCVNEYVNFVLDFNEILSAEDNGTTCRSLFISQDRLDAVLEFQTHIASVWDKGNCNNCFEWDGSIPTTSNNTRKFDKMHNETMDCILDNLNKYGNNTDKVCENCMQLYVELDEFYKSLSSDGIGVDSVCMDVVDLMNTTRSVWSKELDCCKLRRAPEIVFLCCSAIIAALPILFYLAMRYCGPIRDLPNVLKRSGEITKAALAAFYRSVIGLSAQRVDEIIDTAYDRMTSNSYLILDYGTYVHCFTNWLMGKNPNGPGQWVLVPSKDTLPEPPFPVDYSALNTEPAKLEPYAPDKKTNRHSVIV